MTVSQTRLTIPIITAKWGTAHAAGGWLIDEKGKPEMFLDTKDERSAIQKIERRCRTADDIANCEELLRIICCYLRDIGSGDLAEAVESVNQ